MNGLFDDLPEHPTPGREAANAGKARLRVPVRDGARLEVADVMR